MAEVSAMASSIAQAALARGEEPNITRAFELALVQSLRDATYTKNDLTELAAMLTLGSWAVKKVCTETGSFALRNEPHPQHNSTWTDNN